MPAVSLQRNWGCASLAITLTTLEFDFFIQLNPARGKTEENKKKRKRTLKDKSLCRPICTFGLLTSSNAVATRVSGTICILEGGKATRP